MTLKVTDNQYGHLVSYPSNSWASCFISGQWHRFHVGRLDACFHKVLEPVLSRLISSITGLFIRLSSL